jgi:phenylalanine-4-hydroxylase
MRTAYRIDDFQETYFVIDDATHLRRTVNGDLRPVYARLAGTPDFAPGALDPSDVVFTRGTGAHARAPRPTQVIDRTEPSMMS